MVSPVKCTCSNDRNVCVGCLIEGFNEVRTALEETLLELEQWNLTEGEEETNKILKKGFRLLKTYT